MWMHWYCTDRMARLSPYRNTDPLWYDREMLSAWKLSVSATDLPRDSSQCADLQLVTRLQPFACELKTDSFLKHAPSSIIH